MQCMGCTREHTERKQDLGWLRGMRGSSREGFGRAVRMSSCHAPALGLAPVGLGTGSLHAR